MSARDLVALVHLVGFATGIALYGMLAAMTWRASRRRPPDGRTVGGGIPLLAAVLGLLWNASALVVFGWHDFDLGDLSPWYTALAYIALGFLPAVVVDSATRSAERASRPHPLALLAYGLSAIGGALQVQAVAQQGHISTSGLLTLTLGYVAIVLLLARSARGRTGSARALTAVALSAFAVSALHLSHHSSASDSWLVELIGHHASLPLVLVILYQDYRFALADLFLKRALSALALVAIVAAAYATLVAPLLERNASSLRIGVPGVLLGVWIATALAYPVLRRGVHRFVDRVVLHRVDYRALRSSIVRDLSAAATPEDALTIACSRLAIALSASDVQWTVLAAGRGSSDADSLVARGPVSVTAAVPTADWPRYLLTVGHLADGRRLLSDDLALVDTVALLVARRIDELRVSEERFERDLRERDMQRLAVESELRALRAQLNPHFLFNTLTTVGHLITTSPSRALDTLYQLTALLRAVLRRTADFATLREELQLVDAYLAIERARFEERLRVEKDVPRELMSLLIPPLILQPLVENAVKHGISPRRAGGTITIRASLEERDGARGAASLCMSITDTGVGVARAELTRRREEGVGLANVERRLTHYFGGRARLDVASTPGHGTTVEIRLPVTVRAPAVAVS
jgi:signal transduction histidine kinase